MRPLRSPLSLDCFQTALKQGWPLPLSGKAERGFRPSAASLAESSAFDIHKRNPASSATPQIRNDICSFRRRKTVGRARQEKELPTRTPKPVSAAGSKILRENRSPAL